jgi:hypothetical protein
MLNDILAGLVCGLFMGTISLGAWIFISLSNRDMYERLARRLPQGIPLILLMLSLVVALPLAWGLSGIVAGLLYNVSIDHSPGAGLGSPNSVFTLAIICLTALLMLPPLFLIVKRKKLGWGFIIVNLVFAGVFGWILPLFANWR